MTIRDTSTGTRRTVAAAVIGGVLVAVLTALAVRNREQAAPAAAPYEPWQAPITVPSPVPAAPVASSVAVSPSPSPSRSVSRPAPSSAPVSRRPSAGPSSSPAQPPAPSSRPSSPPPVPVNLSLRSDGEADGSTKALGRHFRDVRDGDPGTYWSPIGLSGEVSIKWAAPVTVARVVLSGGRIGDWSIRDHERGTVLASGTGAGAAAFDRVTLGKITLVVRGDGGSPRIAEYQTYS